MPEISPQWKRGSLVLTIFILVLVALLNGVSVYTPPILDSSAFIRFGSSTNSALDNITGVRSTESNTTKVSDAELHRVLSRLVSILEPEQPTTSRRKQNGARQRLSNSVNELNRALHTPFANLSAWPPVVRDQRASKFEGGSRRGASDLRVLFLSKSAPLYHDRRRRIRHGWLSQAQAVSSCVCKGHTNNKKNTICSSSVQVCSYRRMVWYNRFLIGLSKQASALKMLSEEITTHRDFLVSPYEDHYMTLTWKVLWAMEWAVENVDFSFLIFVDDDCFLQLKPLYSYLLQSPQHGVYAGQVAYARAVVQRNVSSRWYVDKKFYGGTYYPEYVWGACLIVTPDVGAQTIAASRDWKPWLGIDDAFIGMLIKAVGFRVKHVPNIHTDASQYRGCGRFGYEMEPIIVVAYDDHHLRELSSAAAKGASLCPLVHTKGSKQQTALPFYVFVSSVIVLFCYLVYRFCLLYRRSYYYR